MVRVVQSNPGLVDLFHACEYLVAAADACSTERKAWMEQQKNALKSNRSSVFKNLQKRNLKRN